MKKKKIKGSRNQQTGGGGGEGGDCKGTLKCERRQTMEQKDRKTDKRKDNHNFSL